MLKQVFNFKELSFSGLGHVPVTHEIEGSNPFSSAINFWPLFERETLQLLCNMPVTYCRDSKGRSAAKRNESAALQRTEGETKDRIPSAPPYWFKCYLKEKLWRCCKICQWHILGIRKDGVERSGMSPRLCSEPKVRRKTESLQLRRICLSIIWKSNFEGAVKYASGIF